MNIWEVEVTYNDAFVMGTNEFREMLNNREKIRFITDRRDINST